MGFACVAECGVVLSLRVKTHELVSGAGFLPAIQECSYDHEEELLDCHGILDVDLFCDSCEGPLSYRQNIYQLSNASLVEVTQVKQTAAKVHLKLFACQIASITNQDSYIPCRRHMTQFVALLVVKRARQF